MNVRLKSSRPNIYFNMYFSCHFFSFVKILTDCWRIVSSHKSCRQQTSLIFYVEGGQNYWTWKVWAGKVLLRTMAPNPWLLCGYHFKGSMFNRWVFIWHNLCAIPCLKYVWWENWYDMHLSISHQKTQIFASTVKEDICGWYHGLVLSKSSLNIFTPCLLK